MENVKNQWWYQGSVNELPKEQQFPVIDIFKFLCAFLILVIHYGMFDSYDGVIGRYLDYSAHHSVARIAVPFYFSSAGYFLFKKINLNRIDYAVIQKYISRILIMLGAWTTLLIIGNKVQLWYLSSLAAAVIIAVLLLRNHVTRRFIVPIAILLYIIGLIGDSYYGLLTPLRNSSSFTNTVLRFYEGNGFTTRNGLFMGTPFVLLGALFAYKKITIRFSTAIIGCIGSMVLMFGEAVAVKKIGHCYDHNMLLLLPVVIFFMMYSATHILLKPHPIYRQLRRIGLLMFYIHLVVKKIVLWTSSAIEKVFDLPQINSLLTFAVYVALSFLCAYFLEKLLNKEKYQTVNQFLL